MPDTTHVILAVRAHCITRNFTGSTQFQLHHRRRCRMI